jgi:hypothetical protein
MWTGTKGRAMRVMDKAMTVVNRFCGITGALLVILVLSGGGCAARRPVYIPEEWRVAPSKPAPVPRPEIAVPPEAGPAAPTLQPLPSIQEEDLSAIPEKDAGGGVVPGEGTVADVTKRTAPTAQNPQYLASMHLVNTAKAFLQQGDAEQAIAQLEQAIQVDAYNAEAFLVLSQAWQARGDLKRALEFARKAEILYQDEPKALKRVYMLEADLLKQSGQVREAEDFRQKAARLGM